MAVRLPVPGSDDGTWGDILNSFLQVAHNADGMLQTSAIQQAGGLTTSAVGAANGVAGLNGSGQVPAGQLGGGSATSSNFLRGDGTWAVPAGGGGGSSTLAGDTDVTLTSPSNNQVLTYNTSSSKWINQAAPVTSVFTRTGAVTAQSGDYTAAQVTNAADKSSASAQTFTGNLSAPAHIASGLTGATAASRYVGATAGGAPASGTFAVGDFIIDQTGKVWICMSAGTPGTWTQSSGGVTLDSTAGDIQPLGTQAAGSVGKAADAGHIHPTTGLVLKAGSTMTGWLAPAVGTLTFGATISVDASSANDFRLTLTASTGTIANPTNPVDGQRITFQIAQDATGSRTVAWGSAYDFGAAGTPTLSTAANKVDLLGFIYNASLAKWICPGSALGF